MHFSKLTVTEDSQSVSKGQFKNVVEQHSSRNMDSIFADLCHFVNFNAFLIVSNLNEIQYTLRSALYLTHTAIPANRTAALRKEPFSDI